ncbi:Spo0E family sporulation regulatory protein-aspartic acid phosphatase [Sporosalibacterium faouarense]|uniref:Spo0E family sporulation regulatory protein-aspartic acid phosphatase n=1 Tax=Sporosalibacterium faouarense TaxID=516123 RepID=UPI00141CDE96|nr:aspartyl-phosphate phosphatase Spo0E family protein [Bacillota bacterium]
MRTISDIIHKLKLELNEAIEKNKGLISREVVKKSKELDNYIVKEQKKKLLSLSK